MHKFLLVGLGGFLGSSLRYGLYVCIERIVQVQYIPWATLSVNILGCFLIGLFHGTFKGQHSVEIELFLVIGLLGGFTTFSSFGHETFQLLSTGSNTAALFNISLHLVVCLLSVWLGFTIVK